MAHINRHDEEFISSAEMASAPHETRLQPVVIIKVNNPVAEAEVKYLHSFVFHPKW